MPDYQFGSSGIVFTDKNFAEKVRTVASKIALDEAVKANPGVPAFKLRGLETYKNRVKFLVSNDKEVKTRALACLKKRSRDTIHAALRFINGGLHLTDKRFMHLIPGAVKLINEAVENGVDLDVIKNDGETLLHCAVKFGVHPAIEALIRRGADINARDKNQQTPLRIAVENGAPGIVQYLINNGADVKKGDDNCPLYDIAKELYEGAPDGEEKKVREKIKVAIKKALVNQ